MWSPAARVIPINSAADRQAPPAHQIERILHVVREGRDLVEPEHGARALDRVQCPKYAADQIPIVRRTLQFEQRRLQFGEQVARLLPVCFPGRSSQHLFHTASSCSAWNGFTIQPVAPAALPCCFLVSCDSVVSSTMGTYL